MKELSKYHLFNFEYLSIDEQIKFLNEINEDILLSMNDDISNFYFKINLSEKSINNLTN